MIDEHATAHHLVLQAPFRAAVALVHSVPAAALELRFADGRSCTASHEPAFRPLLTPCHLRRLVADGRRTGLPSWAGAVVGWDVGGPFVEPVGAGVLAHATGGRRRYSFATSLAPGDVAEVLGALPDGPGQVDVEVRAVGDPLAGATVVHVDRVSAAPVELTEAAATTAARACRRQETVVTQPR